MAFAANHLFAEERVIYRCKVAEVVTFSDVPCEADAKRYQADLSRLSTYTPPPTLPSTRITVKRPIPRRSESSRSAAESKAKQLEECERITQSLRDIRSTMRTGYTAREGERLRSRQDKLEDQRRKKRC
jgi:hypothetical protein